MALPLLVVSVALILSKASPPVPGHAGEDRCPEPVVQENLTGIRVVKSFVREDHEREKFAKRNPDLKSNAEKAFGMVVINMPIMMLIVYGTIIAVMWFGGQMVYAGSLEAGKLITFFHLHHPDHDVPYDGFHDLHDDDPVHRLCSPDCRGTAGKACHHQ